MNPANVSSSGSLVRAMSRDGVAIATGEDLKPGDGQRAEVTIVNLGALAAEFRLYEVDAVNDFEPGRLALAVVELRPSGMRRVYLGEIGAMPAAGIDLGHFEAGESRTYRFTVLLTKETPEDELGGSAAATYQWTAVAGGL